MKKHLLLVSILFLFSCKKKDNPAPAPTLQSAAANVGIKFDKKYWLYSNSGGDSISFHENGTITEYAIGLDTTYPANYTFSDNNSTSLFLKGSAIKIHIPGATRNNYFHLFSACSNSDTATIATFLSGDIIVNNQPTLGISLYNNVNFLLY